jgi:hypothetical protein
MRQVGLFRCYTANTIAVQKRALREQFIAEHFGYHLPSMFSSGGSGVDKREVIFSLENCGK